MARLEARPNPTMEKTDRDFEVPAIAAARWGGPSHYSAGTPRTASRAMRRSSGVLMHEAGRAVFDMFNAPVFGREEGAADEMRASWRCSSGCSEQGGAGALAPRVGFEPTTSRLTAGCSTT